VSAAGGFQSPGGAARLRCGVHARVQFSHRPASSGVNGS
jgi:hypothetical protein